MGFKVWTITLCHNDPDIISDSIDQYYRTKDPSVDTTHIMVDQHWPIKRTETMEKLTRIADRYGCLLLDPGRNLGLHIGFNWAMDQFQIPGNAGVIGFDGDSWPLRTGWDLEMCKTFEQNVNNVWISLWHTHCDRQLIEEGAGEAIEKDKYLARRPVMNSICMWRRDWLARVGGLYEGNAFYGGLECAMWEKVKKPERWIFLKDFPEDLRMHDRVNPFYREFKWRHAHVRDWPGDFESFLRKNHPDAL